MAAKHRSLCGRDGKINTVESIQTFIATFLEEAGAQDKYIGVDWLPTEPGSYSIDIVPTENIVKRYTCGDTIRQCVFVFALRGYYSEDALQNISNIGFFEDFAAWLERCSRSRLLPALDGNRQAQQIEALNVGYLMSDDNDGAGRYQIQCRLTYYQGVNDDE